ncbi:MAG: crotonase/enoyl-CoA hydratase family protein [Actinomycetia bacterium]|nr:crotonase/enoyl-CoA hydratase family protein [Actinomycetes bacterium]
MDHPSPTRFADRVSLTVADGIADVVLDRPAKLNALDGDMIEGIIAAQGAIAADPGIRAVVLRGAGRGFCAGLDTEVLAEIGAGSLSGGSDSVQAAAEDLSPGGAARPQLIGWGWYELPQPVIAALHGPVMGAGMHIALGADIRFAAPDARFAFVETEWGLVPDLSPVQSLRRLVRLDVAQDIVLTSRRINGEEAASLGLVTRSAEDPVAEAMATAEVIASKSPDAMRAAKALLNESGLVSAADGLALELKVSMDLMATPNQIEAVLSRLEGRAAEYDPPPSGPRGH